MSCVAILMFCLLVTLFAAMSSRSTLTREYDPWLDYDDNGVIDMDDIGYTCLQFGTKGNPTKPVVIHREWMEGNFSFSLPPGWGVEFAVTTAGYDRIRISINAYSLDGHDFDFIAAFKIQGCLVEHTRYKINYSYITPPNIYVYEYSLIFPVTFSSVALTVGNPSTAINDIEGNVYYYLTT